MSLRFVVETNPGADDIFSPRVYCDHCSKVISHHSHGVYCYSQDDASSGGSDTWFVHNQCERDFLCGHEGVIGSLGLGMLLFYLTNVLDANMEDAEHNAKGMAWFAQQF